MLPPVESGVGRAATEKGRCRQGYEIQPTLVENMCKKRLLGATRLSRKKSANLPLKKWWIPALLGYLRVLKSAPPSPNVSGLEIETFPSSPPLPPSLGNCLHVHTQGADSTISFPLSPVAKKARTNSRPTPKAFRPSPVKSRAGGRSAAGKKKFAFYFPFNWNSFGGKRQE